MVVYFHDEIDVYVDMSTAAGRQNGLLEAAACGVPLIASDAGTAAQLIEDGVSGIMCPRDVDSLAQSLQKVASTSAPVCTKEMREKVEKLWSWEAQSSIFEKMFYEIMS